MKINIITPDYAYYYINSQLTLQYEHSMTPILHKT
jgi:hypothetical protein